MKSAARKSRIGHGVIAVGGYGVRIAVSRGHLVIDDGLAQHRRTLRFSRVAPDVQRIVVRGHAGTVTLDALRWMTDTGIAFVQLDSDGQLIATNVSRAIDDVRVRRGQALASALPQGVEIARSLLAAKLDGQCAVLRDLGGKRAAVQMIHDARESLDDATTIADLRYIESRAALEYWDGWQGVPMRFGSRDVPRVPKQWLAFDSRRSQLSSSPRKASTPINALLNYLYGILEAEARIAAQRVGCDPSMGLIHADRPSRANFATDLMEPVRPLVDAYVLRLLEQRTFLRSDFFEHRDGHCRLLPPLASALAETAPQWAKAVGPIAEQTAWAFAQVQLPVGTLASSTTRSPVRLRTPLTQRNRIRSVSGQVSAVLRLTARCKDCGQTLKNAARTYCDACLPAHAKRAAAKASETQRHLRAVGQDRRSTPEVRAIHSANAKRQAVLNSAWEAAQTSIPSPSVYRRDIFPRIKGISVRELCAVTGLSTSSCKRVRTGRMTPHPRHWDALRMIAMK
jgi:CRISPR-associated endonuclease Cas1